MALLAYAFYDLISLALLATVQISQELGKLALVLAHYGISHRASGKSLSSAKPQCLHLPLELIWKSEITKRKDSGTLTGSGDCGSCTRVAPSPSLRFWLSQCVLHTGYSLWSHKSPGDFIARAVNLLFWWAVLGQAEEIINEALVGQCLHSSSQFLLFYFSPSLPSFPFFLSFLTPSLPPSLSSFLPFCTGSWYIIQACLKLIILLPQSPMITGVRYHTHPPPWFITGTYLHDTHLLLFLICLRKWCSQN